MQIGQKNRTRKKKGSFGICLHNGNNQSIALKKLWFATIENVWETDFEQT